MIVVPAPMDLLNDRDTFKIWRGVCGNIPTLEFETPKTKGNWLEKRVFLSLSGIGFRTLAGRVRELRGLSSILYENDVLVFKPGIINRLLVVECKFRRRGSVIEKEMAMLFLQRIRDIALYFSATGHPKHLLPLFVSSVPLDRNAFRFCLTYGIPVFHPCFEEGEEYPKMVGCRPPLGTLKYELSKMNWKNSESIARRLLRDIDWLRFHTIKYISVGNQKGPAINGNLLEKAYFDILYRYKYLVSKCGGNIA